jgi:hypothetical protein
MGMDPIRQTMKDWCNLDLRFEHAKATFDISERFVTLDQRNASALKNS